MEDSQVRHVVAPLTLEQIKEYFENKDIIFLIDYNKSELQGIKLLTYLSNLELPAEIYFSEDLYEKKEELLSVFLEAQSMCESKSILTNIAILILEKRGIDTSQMYMNPILTREEIKKFIQDHSKLLETWERFLESTNLYAQSCIEGLVEKKDLITGFGEINDRNAVGSNVVFLFNIPAFMELFFSQGVFYEMKYYTPQFEEYMFRGNNLYSYFACEENTPFKMLLAHIDGELDFKAIDNEIEQLEQLTTDEEKNLLKY